ncbi:class I SAM-dependent methyltransferase [Patescibacteria group bacterium]|nr:class I SAM-dependent methyltransferase [Patescibacteria group bacterium]
MNKSEKIIKDTKNNYNKIAEHFSQTRYAPWAEFELFSKYIKEGQKILDLGCGNGRLFFSYLKDFKVEYYGLDNSEKLIEIAKNKNPKIQETSNKQYPNPKFQTGEMTTLPYKDNYFDLIFCIATFHHLPTKVLRLKTLSEIRRVLKPGGYLLMTNWHLWHKPYLKYFFNQFSQKISWKDFFKPWKLPNGQILGQRYIYAFTKRELKGFIKKSGLLVEKVFINKNPQSKIPERRVNVVAIGKKQ